MRNTVIISAKRTPFGSFGGSLKSFSATELALIASEATLKSTSLSPHDIEHVVFGQVIGANSDSAYLPRHVGLKLGIPLDRPAYLVNRLCGSGFQSWIEAHLLIQVGQANCILAGGVESMSQIPYLAKGVRFGDKRMGNFALEDLLNSALTDQYPGLPMAMTAEKLGEQYGISREDVDQYSLLSQQRYQKALSERVYQNEIIPMKIKSKKGDYTLKHDEHAKPDTTLEKLRALKPLFKENGLVTAGTASGIVDGAAATLICDESFAKHKGLKPLARIIHTSVVGCSPDIMGIGPVAAIRKLLKETQVTQDQIDLIEVNEAFAAQYLAVEKELSLPRDKTNVNGGAIALGHPLGASGTRIMNHLTFELQRKNLKYAVGSACIGGGQGIAILIERI
jgi:acetyl-CoA C-acetyltransferase/acetyl-CoA acyltransferase 2